LIYDLSQKYIIIYRSNFIKYNFYIGIIIFLFLFLMLIILFRVIKNNKWFCIKNIINIKYYLYNIIRFWPIKADLPYNDLLRLSNNINFILYCLKRDRDLIYIINLKQFETTHNKYIKSIKFLTNWIISNNYIFIIIL